MLKTNKDIKLVRFSFESSEYIKKDPVKLRGFFGNRFKEYVLLHNHDGNKLIYRYPLVQYKFIDNKPLVIGLNEGAEVLKEIYDKSESVIIGSTSYKIMERSLIFQQEEFGLTDKLLRYTFKTPWLALNQDNYDKYLTLKTQKQKSEMLTSILIGNIISVAKSLNYQIEEQILVNLNVQKVETRLKGKMFIGFKGEFVANFELPDYIGLGKSVSRGFGTIIKCN